MHVWGGLLWAVMGSHWGAAGKTVEEWGYVTHHGCVSLSQCEWEGTVCGKQFHCLAGQSQMRERCTEGHRKSKLETSIK